MEREQLLSKLENQIPEIAEKEIWIWGAGHTAQLYQEGLKRIKKFRICGYCDNASEKWGRIVDGKPVISPEELYQRQNVCVLICSPQREVVSAVGLQLSQKNIEWHCLDETIFKLYRTKIIKCYDLLDDQLSKDTYAHMINCHMEQCRPDSAYICDNEYFSLPQFMDYGDETYVDCGAFTGDTIEKYIWKKNAFFQKIIAFEPDRGNFQAMGYRMERLEREWNIAKDRIELHCLAVGRQHSSIALEENGDMSSMAGGFACEKDAAHVEVVSLDEFLKEPYSFLKADIESYEYEMLEGASQGIKTYKPLLAICIYHNAMDLFEIQLLIHSLVPEYKFAIRHHSTTLSETVLYAYL